MIYFLSGNWFLRCYHSKTWSQIPSCLWLSFQSLNLLELISKISYLEKSYKLSINVGLISVRSLTSNGHWAALSGLGLSVCQSPWCEAFSTDCSLIFEHCLRYYWIYILIPIIILCSQLRVLDSLAVCCDYEVVVLNFNSQSKIHTARFKPPPPQKKVHNPSLTSYRFQGETPPAWVTKTHKSLKAHCCRVLLDYRIILSAAF